MSTTPFQKAYHSLNEGQRKAVDTIEGPVMVIAGPGTGKTQVLTVRIANILSKTDTDPSAILALTFTESAAKEMKSRLINLTGRSGFFAHITTFHSFCSDIINENPDRFSRPKGMQVATDLEKIEIVTSILESGSFLALKSLNNPTYYLKDILSSISTLKREGITVGKFKVLVKDLTDEFELERETLKKTAFGQKEKLVHKNIDLLSIYQSYEQELRDRGRFDFDDMINWVVESFENDEEFLLKYQERYQYILVDEYQDTNSAQNKLIFTLSSFWGENANIFVVGDSNQSIYRFQGASQENIYQFEKRFPNHTKVFLDQNYRSTKTILKAAASLISDSQLKHNVEYKNKKIKVVKFSSPIYEDEFITNSISSKLKHGLSPNKIAVIAKENKDLEHLANSFKAKNIPYRLGNGGNILNTPLISQFIKIIKVVVRLPSDLDDLDLFTILNYPYFHLDSFAVLKQSRKAYLSRTSLLDSIIAEESNPEIKSVLDKLVKWNSRSAHCTLSQIFQIILQESGILDFILSSEQPSVELTRFNTLYEDLKTQISSNQNLSLTGYVNNLTIMESNGVKLEELELDTDKEAVTLITAHKSKGLEWEVVYVYRFADSHWGNKTRRENIKLPDSIIESKALNGDKNDEERRLFYVALTRARHQLYLCGSIQYPNSAKMIFPSIFLSDLPKRQTTKLKSIKYQKDLTGILSNILSTGIIPQVSEDEEIYLKQIISELKISPTSLNTYLACHYKFKLDNLYRIPRAKAPVMCFGTAVHYALELLYQRLEKNQKLESKDVFLNDFEFALKREFLTPIEQKERLMHGRKILSAYYDQYQDGFRPALFAEKNFGTKNHPVFLGDIQLSGKSDRIDLINASAKTVRFVDYKTGKPKTRGVLEKDHDGPDGDYKRQLIFYNLLSSLDHSFGYKVVETELDFIEPDKDGKFHRERFVITQEEVDKLKDVIKDSVEKIRSLNFERTSNHKTCDRCDFKSHCWPEGLPVTSEPLEE